jgi:hypothetical protein
LSIFTLAAGSLRGQHARTTGAYTLNEGIEAQLQFIHEKISKYGMKSDQLTKNSMTRVFLVPGEGMCFRP